MFQSSSSLRPFLASIALALVAVVACQAAPITNLVRERDGGADTTPEPETNDAGSDPDTGPTTTDPDEAAAPVVTSMDPSSAPVGSVGPTVVVTGKNFVERSVVQLDGAALATSFVSDSELRATIPSSKLTAVGTLRVSVGTAPPGGGASKDLTFNVVNPTPSLTALEPLSVVAGSGGTSLDVTGDGFVSSSKIVFGSTDLATTFVDKTHLTATIPSGSVVDSATVPVTVVTPAPGGGTSSAISFTISNPAASITSISPSSALFGAGSLSLTVNGTGFVGTSAVLFNGSALPTTFASSGKLTAQVPSSAFTSAGDFPVSVQNAPPGGGVSAPVVFHVQYAVPTASSVSPSTANAGAPPTTITVTGGGFNTMSQITLDDAPEATTFVDTAHVSATIAAADLATPGTHQVRVVNPSPGGGTSAALSFSVSNPAPTLTSVSPASIDAGSSDTTITLTGTGFLSASVVKSNGVILASSYVSATSFTATVTSGQLAAIGSLAITVTNPSPGGGTSASKSVTVAPPANCTEAAAGGGVFNGHCYFLYTTAGAQAAASTACTNKGGHLVTMTSQAEFDFVRTIGGGASRWIGLTTPTGSTDPTQFSWITSETPIPPASWWDVGNPQGSRQCAIVDSNNLIADRYCTGNSYTAICER